MSILLPREPLNLHTRMKHQVDNEIDRTAPRPGDQIACQDYAAKYKAALHRPVGPSRAYNCHGLVFACRRTWIHESREISRILSDDDYQEVEFSKILPGDIVVYFKQGDAEHSGVVINSEGPKILSKWGACQEVVHKLWECPYDSDVRKFYRIVR